MNPKEKAKELISLHSLTIISEVGNKLTMHEVKQLAKQAALLSVDEVLEDTENIYFWHEVKSEIEAL